MTSRPTQEEHPEVTRAPRNAEEACLQLIHRKAYETAAARAEGLRVLDVGCNNGYGTRALATRAASVVGVDVSPRLLQSARRGGLPDNVELRQVDGRTLPFPDGSFDLVTGFQVIEHVEDTGPFLEEIVRVLAPAGGALFTTPNAAIRLDPGMEPWNPFHVREYRAAELRAQLAPWFGAVEILGLFGANEIQQIELARLDRARSLARAAARPHRRLLRALKRGIGRAVPAPARAPLRALLSRPTPEPAPGPAFAHLDLDDLRYRPDDLDGALDLLAICTKTAAEPPS